VQNLVRKQHPGPIQAWTITRYGPTTQLHTRARINGHSHSIHHEVTHIHNGSNLDCWALPSAEPCACFPCSTISRVLVESSYLSRKEMSLLCASSKWNSKLRTYMKRGQYLRLMLEHRYVSGHMRVRMYCGRSSSTPRAVYY